MKTWKNITEVKKANKELGNHWFEASAMRFFETRIESKIICGNLFITSEVNPHGEKKFSIREVNDDGSINTLGSFHSFATKADALEVCQIMTNRKPNQAKRILAHMEAGKSITPIVALMQFGCLRLSARVYELKLAGHVIQSAKVQTGNGKWVAKYWID